VSNARALDEGGRKTRVPDVKTPATRGGAPLAVRTTWLRASGARLFEYSPRIHRGLTRRA